MTTLPQVGAGRLGSEGIQSEVVLFLGIESKRDGGTLSFGEAKVELAVGVETLDGGVSLHSGKTLDWCPDKPVLEDCVNATRLRMSGPVIVIRGVADSTPTMFPSRTRGRGITFCSRNRNLLKSDMRVSTLATALPSLPYSGSYGSRHNLG